MKKYLLLALVFLEYPLLLISHKLEPTNMAGPGLDLLIILISLIYNICMVLKGILSWKRDIFPKLYILASIISFALIGYWMTKPL